MCTLLGTVAVFSIFPSVAGVLGVVLSLFTGPLAPCVLPWYPCLMCGVGGVVSLVLSPPLMLLGAMGTGAEGALTLVVAGIECSGLAITPILLGLCGIPLGALAGLAAGLAGLAAAGLCGIPLVATVGLCGIPLVVLGTCGGVCLIVYPLWVL
jgi:hypothetical protein